MSILARFLPGPALVAVAFALVTIGSAFAFSSDDSFGPPAPAPGPIAGAGLPILAAIGYGAYRFIKRFRRKSD
jgi:hypothetical protein